ncbi:hypothetical protein [Rhodopseudomonas palustris]|uniref:hypothetical protein n=1 Tax=Rhodopseudomonas palustris TaxID=1076 RepID=UPI001AEC45E9|nr:hypothetical protein [Rhodopseudomonas palustris]
MAAKTIGRANIAVRTGSVRIRKDPGCRGERSSFVFTSLPQMPVRRLIGGDDPPTMKNAWSFGGEAPYWIDAGRPPVRSGRISWSLEVFR